MKLTDKIHLLQIDFEIQVSPEKKLPRFVNVILIFSDKITIIDTGVKGSEKQIFDYITENNRNYSEIGTVILSHSHPDHIGSAAAIKELTKCKVLAHKSEREWIENIQLQYNQRPVPGFFNLVDKSVTIDELLTHGQEIKVENGLTLKIIHSPGHSKGSLNILFREDRILFTADSIPLKNDIPNYDNYSDLIKSLDTIKQNKDYGILLTSWTPIIYEKDKIQKILAEGTEYLHKIDSIVKDSYKSGAKNPERCKDVISKLGLPPIFANPLSDNAFKSHFD